MIRKHRKHDCYKCVHKLLIKGDAHVGCDNPAANVVGDEIGIRKGWFRWPYNFDPTWLVSCDGFKEERRLGRD